jgi:hypothetical protein
MKKTYFLLFSLFITFSLMDFTTMVEESSIFASPKASSLIITPQVQPENWAPDSIAFGSTGHFRMWSVYSTGSGGGGSTVNVTVRNFDTNELYDQQYVPPDAVYYYVFLMDWMTSVDSNRSFVGTIQFLIRFKELTDIGDYTYSWYQTVTNEAPVLTQNHPAVITRDINENFTLNWTISDTGHNNTSAQHATYYLNNTEGVIIESGEWHPLDDVVYTSHISTPGTYFFGLCVDDGTGNKTHAIQQVTILNDPPELEALNASILRVNSNQQCLLEWKGRDSWIGTGFLSIYRNSTLIIKVPWTEGNFTLSIPAYSLSAGWYNYTALVSADGFEAFSTVWVVISVLEIQDVDENPPIDENGNSPLFSDWALFGIGAAALIGFLLGGFKKRKFS